MHRLLLGVALIAACGGSDPAASPRVVVAPLLDSLFVGETKPARSATYLDARGDTQPAGPVRWASRDTNVARVDSVTGEIVGRGPGTAILEARANGVTGTAFLVVSRVLDLSLLLDTIYLMPGDTFTVPFDLRVKSGGPATVWFRTPANPYFAVDSASGRDSAIVAGPARPFYVFAALGPDTVADTGATEVVQLTDTVGGGKGFFSVLGTVIRRARSGARAVHYRREGDTVTFRISLPITQQGIVVENVLITLRDSVPAAGTFPLDSISLAELLGSGANPVCRPPRPWALWSFQTNPPLRALSRRGGSLAITQVTPIAHGRAISGRFVFTGQRADLYDDPLAALPIRGTFVAPLIADARPCR
ncbi:MAG: hypothetical protein WD773_08315 [Gemmatimonadales bacterium]